MSWDKQTANLSKLDAVKETLDELEIPYTLTVIAEFRGRGLNDAEGEEHQLRRLQYANKVILEYAELEADCDTDDKILSRTFGVDEEPKDWRAIREINAFDEELGEFEYKDQLLWDDKHKFEQEYFV